MSQWNGTVMYAPLTPEHYAIPGATHCVFRVMQESGDTHAWNLYWLSRPDTDLLLTRRLNWFHHFRSLSTDETEAFYEALDTEVCARLTLAALVALPAREALALLPRARLERTRFYSMAGAERWRQTMLGRLFLAARLEEPEHTMPAEHNASIVWIDFHTRHPTLKNGTHHEQR